MDAVSRTRPKGAGRGAWLGLIAWCAAWCVAVALDGDVDLSGLALLFVLAAAVAAIGWPAWLSVAVSALCVLGFDLAFVPPRGLLTVEMQQHGLLLLAMLGVSWVVAALMGRLRAHAAEAGRQADRSDQLRALGDTLRESDDPLAGPRLLASQLAALSGQPGVLRLAESTLGEPTPDEALGLDLCLREGRAMGPGSGRYDDQPAWYLPLRGKRAVTGAALVRLDPLLPPPTGGEREHAQALCDLLGAAQERATALAAAALAREQAQLQSLRNTLLSAIAHDHRTPLATIVGAATALHDQGERLGPAQRQRLAATIVDEARQLARITENTLQLARLDAVGPAIARDWESVEELVGSVLRRYRQRDPAGRLRVRVDPDLPLLRCDAVLIVQLLENLVDNALHHGGEQGPVELTARRLPEGQLCLSVADRGPGVPVAQRDAIFETFARGGGEGSGHRRGAGVGLALCRAIARVHGGDIRLRARQGGGARFEVLLPEETPPPGPSP